MFTFKISSAFTSVIPMWFKVISLEGEEQPQIKERHYS